MLTTFVTLLIAGFLYESCAAKCRKKRLTSKCSGFQQTTSQAYLLFIKRSSEANIQSCDNLWNTFCYINNECIEEIFLLPSPFSTFPSRYLFKGTFVERGLGRVRTRIPINNGNLSSCNEDERAARTSKKKWFYVWKSNNSARASHFLALFSLLKGTVSCYCACTKLWFLDRMSRNQKMRGE